MLQKNRKDMLNDQISTQYSQFLQKTLLREFQSANKRRKLQEAKNITERKETNTLSFFESSINESFSNLSQNIKQSKRNKDQLKIQTQSQLQNQIQCEKGVENDARKILPQKLENDQNDRNNVKEVNNNDCKI
ncbi:unnamed protein product [Paramecium sonneborni]|uniref:Uncharacterized protein n=1 Tax=Paramecium sonneborni TaxID=65129 RepID=A0A8S1KLV2_9CILI|nr:unnamed protein product [Paramecium sonneborni]